MQNKANHVPNFYISKFKSIAVRDLTETSLISPQSPSHLIG